MRNPSRKEAASIDVMAGLLVVTLLSVTSFAIDFGMAYSNKRVLQNAADAAALAAGRNVVQAASPTKTCADILADPSIRDPAWQVARDYLIEGAPLATLPAATPPVDFLTCSADGKKLIVTTQPLQTQKMVLGPLLGLDTLSLAKTSKVVVGASGGTPPGLRPIAICNVAARALASAPGQLFIYYLDSDVDTGCGDAAGNYAMVGFDGANTPEALASLLINGWTGSLLTSPIYTDANPGADNSHTVLAAYDAILNTEFYIPVFDQFRPSAGGNNAGIRIVSYMKVQLCAWRTASSKSGVGTCSAGSTLPGTGTKYFQMRYIRSVPVLELSSTCKLGDPCDLGLRVVKLAD